MEPRIQYARTSDGVNIAYAAVGEGPPVLLVVLPFSHLQLEWQLAQTRRLYEAAASQMRFIRYDPRGTGSSTRDIRQFSLESFLLDIDAVVEQMALRRLALVAVTDATPVAIAYAARRPEVLSHLVLWAPFARSRDAFDAPQGQAYRALRTQDWEVYTETIAYLSAGREGDAEAARETAALWRKSVTKEAALAIHTALEEFDVTDSLPQVNAPTLVLHHENFTWPPVELARSVAAQIPNARLVAVEGTPPLAAMAVTSGQFILGHPVDRLATPSPARPEALSDTVIILFADIADSTALTERLGDAAFRAKARELDGAMRGVIRENAGTPIEGKLLGDGVLAVFTSARQAIEAALRCGKAGDEAGLPLHLGLHAGDVIREENNVYGGAVNIASRISGLSAAGEVLVSDTVRSLARTSAGVTFEDRGEQSLKGVGEPVRVWAVRPSTDSGRAEA